MSETGTPDPGPSPRTKAESVKLWLPSQLDPKDRDSICLGGVIGSEKEFRFAQLEDALDSLCRTRRIRRGLVIFHKVQLGGEGQKTQTKSRAVLQTIQDRIDKCARRYRVARDALLSLDPCGDWQNLYPILTNDNNRGPGKEPEEMSSSDGQYVPSWLWRSATTAVSPDEVNEDMRTEWAQCMARADRWEEEVLLLQEEMRRVVQFLEWRSTDWFAKVGTRAGAVTPMVHAGLSAYANKQGSVFHNLAIQFSRHWHSALTTLSLPHAWATLFLDACKDSVKNPDFKKCKPPGNPPVVPTHGSSPPPTTIATSAPPPPTTSKAGHDGGQGPDTGSDGTSSEYSESEYGSDSSWAE